MFAIAEIGSKQYTVVKDENGKALSGKLTTNITYFNTKNLPRGRFFIMARAIRIEYENTFYHVTSRGNERKKGC